MKKYTAIMGLKGIKREELTAGALMGAALFVGFSLQIIGLQYTTPSKNAFLTATNVVIVPFIAFLICRKKIGLRGIAGAVLAIAGVGLLSLDRDPDRCIFRSPQRGGEVYSILVS